MTKIDMPSYNIFIKEGAIRQLSQQLTDVYHGRHVFIITDRHVSNLYLQTIESALPDHVVQVVEIEPGEVSKSLDVYQQVISKLLSQGIKRDHLIIAFGGGVVGDLAGYVAATLYRGMAYVHIPTTLLAQVDSSIGGKVGIDLPEGKNLIGAFHQPGMVLIDPAFLKTLEPREYANGLAEMIKAGLIGDARLYQDLLIKSTVDQEDIIRAIHVKRKLVLADPYDHHERLLLNFGHTFGHAIEQQHGYRTYKHGEAISHGMLMALEIGIRLGVSSQALYDEVKTLLVDRQLVQEPLLDRRNYLDALVHDKKQMTTGLRFVLVEQPGKALVKVLQKEDLS
ncbi:MAG: 3-dehydroquinate synthase [Acholeplasmataceae bacterium]|nr:MAG: 3-dehydroquinate synthase [Acholeplasmataceae bacterium]